ncbi:MAG: hypothetical protein ACM34O_15885 [Ignavibacteria bacterium]
MWYGKGFNDGIEKTEIEKRLEKIEKMIKEKEKEENFTLTGSYAGGDQYDEVE